MTTTTAPSPPALIEGRFSSVAALLQAQATPATLKEKFETLQNETHVVQHLTIMRQSAGLTQEEMARLIGVSQSAISKLESSKDEEITLGQIKAYTKAANRRMGLTVGKPLNHVEAVKYHALEIRERLSALASMANKYEEMQKDISAFFGEAFFNILKILGECGNQLPAPCEEDGNLSVNLFGDQEVRQSPTRRGRRHKMVGAA